jgi:hypothetical protein
MIDTIQNFLHGNYSHHLIAVSLQPLSFPVCQTTVRVQLSLNRSLLLCGNNNDTDCCPEPLCVLETLRVSACLGNTSQASLLIQARIYAQVFPTEPVSGKSGSF